MYFVLPSHLISSKSCLHSCDASAALAKETAIRHCLTTNTISSPALVKPNDDQDKREARGLRRAGQRLTAPTKSSGSKNHCGNECHDQTLGNDQTEQQSKKLCTRPKAPHYLKGSSSYPLLCALDHPKTLPILASPMASFLPLSWGLGTHGVAGEMLEYKLGSIRTSDWPSG
jgi:hypothetical protein